MLLTNSIADDNLITEGIAAYRTAARPLGEAVNVSWRFLFVINPLQDQSRNPNGHQQKRAQLI